jgi:ferredoxin
MTSWRRNWGIYLCRCSLPASFDPAPLLATEAVVEIAAGPAALPGFAARLRPAFTEQVLFACTCAGPERLASACDAVGIAPEVHPLALGAATLAVPDAREASAKALRLVLGTVAGIDARPAVPQNLLAVGNRVAVFADRPVGLELAKHLSGMSLVVFLEGDPAGFGRAARTVNWGRPEAVRGRLGALETQVAPVAGSDFSAPQRVVSDQVIVMGERAAAIRARTGVYRLPAPHAGDLERVAQDVRDHMGTFSKPEHVRYDSAVCAGGAADRQVCGRCIPACPYDAVARDPANPLRIRVDHFACEGCGACTSACPTSALRFTEPAPEELYARLAALLTAPAGAADGGGAAPAIVFHCEQQGRALLEWAAAQGHGTSARILPVEVPCLRYVSEAAMLGAVRLGAAGVGLLGCETCPNGERELLLQKLQLSQQVLDGFGLNAGRVRLLTVREDARPEALQALRTFADGLGQPAVPPDGKRLRGVGNRAVLADAIGAFIAATGKEVGGLRLAPEQPFALAEVAEQGCTLCRACATVCPTHAFAFDMDAQELRFRHIDCVNCGLCEAVCPEKVITLRTELYLERQGLEYVTVAKDEMVHCARCKKPYINRRALEAVQAKLRSVQAGQDAFLGKRADLLRMCPDCRGVAAMLEVNEGWRP